MATVEYDRVSKSFGNVRVMQDISLEVADRRFVVLLGPSGCGKTTLLRMTAGLETITAGEIRIGGRRMNNVHPRDRDIAMVFQNYALYPTMKVFDNIAFSLQVNKLPKPEIEKKVRWAADLLGLTDYLDRYPKALSGGQRQRVAMGRALVRDPKVFLFDEPLSNLDAKLRGQMRYEIRRIHDRLETTSIYVTHDQIEAMTMADEIVVMRNGNIEQIGSPDAIYDRPANLFVADFIGAPPMNFLQGVVEGEGASRVFRFRSLKLPLPDGPGLEPGRALVYGLRPVDVVVGPSGVLSGEMVLSENTGSETMIHLGLDGEDLRAVVPGRPHLERGQKVGFEVPPAKVHLFDPDTGMRIT
jgi:multiple sugar transport system ATP-binding protein